MHISPKLILYAHLFPKLVMLWQNVNWPVDRVELKSRTPRCYECLMTRSIFHADYAKTRDNTVRIYIFLYCHCGALFFWKLDVWKYAARFLARECGRRATRVGMRGVLAGWAGGLPGSDPKQHGIAPRLLLGNVQSVSQL